MTIYTAADRQAFQTLLPTLCTGDCVQVDSMEAIAANSAEVFEAAAALEEHEAELISRREGIDTRDENGKIFFALCRALCELDAARPPRKREGIEKAKEEGRYKGRKPIPVDESLFDSVVSLWQSGEITAREAMARLDLKPNTFYRRIKEREELKMKDYKKVEHEIKEEIKEAARQSRRNLDELKKQVRAEAKEAKKAADETLELRDVEREMRRDRARAEDEHKENVRQMKKDVEAEAKELKKMMENKD